MKEVKLFSPLEEWLDRRTDLKSYINIDDIQADFELGGFLIFDNVIPIYQAIDLEAESLDLSWQKTNDYLEKAFDIINEEYPQKISLDKEEARMILDELDKAPKIMHPIYIMTVEKDNKEEIVYIGQTSSSKSRFKGGHSAISKLHLPKFEGFTKKLYQCGILLLNEDNELVPLEWIKPLDKAKELLNSIEAQLIFHFQPELNILLKKNNNTTKYIQLHLQNRNNFFMHDTFV